MTIHEMPVSPVQETVTDEPHGVTDVEPVGSTDVDDTPVSAIEELPVSPADDTPVSPVITEPPTGEAAVEAPVTPAPEPEDVATSKTRDGGGKAGLYRIAETVNKRGKVIKKEFFCLMSECTRPNEPFDNLHGWSMHKTRMHVPAEAREARNAAVAATRTINLDRKKKGLPPLPGSHKKKSQLAKSIDATASAGALRKRQQRQTQKEAKEREQQPPVEPVASPVITATETDIRAYESSVVAFDALIPAGSITSRNMREAEQLRQHLEDVARLGLSALQD